MSIPDYQAIMLPLLQFAGDGSEYSLATAREELAKHFQLTPEEMRELLPSGKQTTFHNRVGWAKTYLEKSRLLESPKRGYFKITERGLQALAQEPRQIDNAFLWQYAEFKAFKSRKNRPCEDAGGAPTEPAVTQEKTLDPEEALDAAHLELKNGLASDILEAIGHCPPEFFESLVVDLLIRMGYGGSRREAGQAIGRSGDGGIDGIIKEDRIGLDIVYIQAKRWDSVVGRPEIQKFAGALQGKRARKGIFITTSRFCPGPVGNGAADV